MDNKTVTLDQTMPCLKVVLAAELFSKLPERQQDLIINQLKVLLSHE